MSKEQAKTILTRAAGSSKIILTGDLMQIDEPKLDAQNNGLTHVIEKFKDQNIAGHITLVDGQRSELATLAGKIL
jgi:PhoH-like ATPase